MAGSGSVPRTNGSESGSKRPKNLRRNTAQYKFAWGKGRRGWGGWGDRVYLVEVCGGEWEDADPHLAALAHSGTIRHLPEQRRVVVHVQDGDVNRSAVGERRLAPVPRLYSEKEGARALVINARGHRDETAVRINAEDAMFVAADNSVADLGVDADVPRGGEQADDVGADRDALCHRGEVVLARELRGVVVDV